MAENKPMPVRTARVELTGDYEGFWAELQTNCPYAVKLELNSGDAPRVLAAFAPLVRAWNLTDANGALLALPVTPETLTAGIPDDALGQLLAGYREAQDKAAQLPLA